MKCFICQKEVTKKNQKEMVEVAYDKNKNVTVCKSHRGIKELTGEK